MDGLQAYAEGHGNIVDEATAAHEEELVGCAAYASTLRSCVFFGNSIAILHIEQILTNNDIRTFFPFKRFSWVDSEMVKLNS